jgi:hypothetical protein
LGDNPASEFVGNYRVNYRDNYRVNYKEETIKTIKEEYALR